MHYQSNGMTLDECLRAADETKEFILKEDALKEVPSVLRAYFDGMRLCLLIADDFTYDVAGKNLQDILKGENISVHRYIFPGTPRLHADYDHVKTLIGVISTLPDYKNVVPIAVGAGTINDLVKRAAFELDIPYICVATASSVDGYTANGSSLLGDGFKQVFPCSAPKVVIADTDVLANAPAYLSSSGFGDLASKIIAGTDWILSDMASTVGAPSTEAIDEKAWAMTQPSLYSALHASIDAVRGDRDAVKTLFGALAVTGFAMQYYKSSRPVSGVEHAFSHIWEMEDLSVNGVPVTHGHKVAIGTLSALAFTELFFADPDGPPPVSKSFKRPSRAEREQEVAFSFKDSAAKVLVVKTALNKYMEDVLAERVNELIRDSWRELRSRINERLIPYKELKALLERGGCPVLPESINLTRAKTIATAHQAQMSRVRYGILDLAWDMGNFETILRKIEDSDVYLR